MNRLTRLITLSLILTQYILSAQKDTSGHIGHVVTLKNDTLKGRVYNHHKFAHAYIVLKHFNNTPKDTTLFPKEVSLYTANDKVYKTIKLPNGNGEDTTYQFAQIIVKGPI